MTIVGGLLGLSIEEDTARSRLVDSGLARSESTAAVLLVSRRPARPQVELVDWLTQFDGLDDPKDTTAIVLAMQSKKWLIELPPRLGQVPLVASPDLGKKLSVIAESDEVEWLLRSPLPNKLPPAAINVVGQMTDSVAYSTYLERITSAKREITLPVMRPNPDEAASHLILERARQGVTVRMLIASRAVVAELWGEAAARETQWILDGWRRHSAEVDCLEVRVARRADAMRIATCVGIDDAVVRWDVYDFRRQRTLEGVMVEITSPTGFSLNVNSLFYDEFQRTWRLAYKANASRLGVAARILGRQWRWILTAGFLGGAYATSTDAPFSSVLDGVAATFAVNALAHNWADIREWVSHVARKLARPNDR